jgi:hypothetical protein
MSEPAKRRLAAKVKSIRFSRLKEIARVATPQTLIKWYRNFIGRGCEENGNRGPGRCARTVELRELVVRLAQQNRG